MPFHKFFAIVKHDLIRKKADNGNEFHQTPLSAFHVKFYIWDYNLYPFNGQELFCEFYFTAGALRFFRMSFLTLCKIFYVFILYAIIGWKKLQIL